MQSFILKKKNIFHFIKNPILINVFTVGFMTLIVKGMGFYKEMEVGSHFGLSEILDTFLIATLIPGFINTVFMSSFQNVFVPNYIAEMRTSSTGASFLSACVILTFGLGIVLMLVSYLFTDLFLESVFKNHSLQYYHLIRSQFYVVLPCILFWSFSSLFSCLLEIKGLFGFSSISSVFTSIVILGCLFFFKNQMGYTLLAIGMLVGSFLELAYVLIVSVYKKTLQFAKPNFNSSNIKMIYKQLPSKIGSGFLTGSTGFVNQFFAAQLAVGSIASFNYGMKIPSFLATVLVISIGNVILPYFSNLVQDNRQKAYRVLYQSITTVFFTSLIIAAFLFIFSETTITLLFERGNFTAQNTLVVSQIQKIILIYVPFYIATIIIIKFLTSINKNIHMFYASIINLVLNVILNYYFAKKYGIYGLAIATTLVYSINFIVLFVFVRYQQRKDLSL
ncbi:putative peptidoglycan lipid II flippase [Flavobacterium sp. 103]|nr:putative peptidoglycan lipid II flippase [Flavobacterium sp. 103]